VGISKSDIVDVDFVDAPELKSPGGAGATVNFTTTVVSTTSGTQTVVVNLAADGGGIRDSMDHPVEAGDLVVLSGTSGGLGDGTFHVASVVGNTTFTVVETIGTSTGGAASFKFDAGALDVGVNTAGFAHSSSTTVQGALADLDAAIGGTFVRVVIQRNGSFVVTTTGDLVYQL